MKKENLKSIIIMVLLVALIGALQFIPAFAQPGDAGDPLVTRRYVDDRIATLSREIALLRDALAEIGGSGVGNQHGAPPLLADQDSLFQDLIRYFEDTYGEFLDSLLYRTGEVVPFTPLLIPAGSTLVGEAGAEFILRSGNAVAVSGPDGMVNVTSGVDIVNGTQIPRNNLLLVPRSDGRGFFAETDVWLMIKGGYRIDN